MSLDDVFGDPLVFQTSYPQYSVLCFHSAGARRDRFDFNRVESSQFMKKCALSTQ